MTQMKRRQRKQEAELWSRPSSCLRLLAQLAARLPAAPFTGLKIKERPDKGLLPEIGPEDVREVQLRVSVESFRPNSVSASARASSVLPTPVGPRNRNDPMGRFEEKPA